MISRRVLLMAPAIVAVSNLMPLRGVPLDWSTATPDQIIRDIDAMLREFSIATGIPRNRLLSGYD
jgi:hypothetical protein